MSQTQRMFAIIIAAALLVSGFAFARMTESPKTTAAEDNKALVNELAPNSTKAANENQSFYLSDYKTGYNDGYNSGAAGELSSVATTDRAGYNEGFKQGYGDGYQAKMSPKQVQSGSNLGVPVNRFAPQQMAYRPAAPAKKSSKLKTILTIAAPAAVGAGVGAAVGGKKGAGVGALIGGGGGALYHLYKNR